jgi:type I restriction-modification system DNA methylase subunit
MPQITEWEFTADIVSRINAILAAHSNLPFTEARAEARARGSIKRRDITLYDRASKIVLTGELKMPDSPEGRTPLQQGVVEDAHRKADEVGAEYNFTWNVNRLVLWKTLESGKPITERAVETYNVLPTPIHNSDDTRHPRVLNQIDSFLLSFLQRFAALLSGEQPMLLMPLDAKFIFAYEASLEQPVAQTLSALSQQYQRGKEFKRDLDKWMRDEQGWVLSNDEEIVRDNLERAAKFSCYVLANKIVFYKALRRRFNRMRALRIPQAVTQGAELGKHLEDLFQHALKTTGDYETVFQGGFGDTLPFLNDAAVGSWRELSEQTDGFDFTQINHEVVGLIFERLLSTEERHKYGQHYTRSEVVDLINAFCIRKADVRVLDPACGGGTFLVRAYARKRALSNGALHHRDLIQQLYGFDISAYPVHLTTINLVTRDLVDEANYPLIARRDFFDVMREDAPFIVPFKDNGEILKQHAIGNVDAVVGNPPYVRQEKIAEYYGAQYKRRLQEMITDKEAIGAALSGRSDIHVYFFPHAATFLKDGGYLGLLTSSTWLDTTYGFRLQKYLLDHFEIIAIFESASEPWFTGARVTTAATILRKQSDGAKRANNIVHFVKIQRELSDILETYDNEAAQRKYFERLRDHIESLKTNEATDDFRVRCIRQSELYELGRAKIQVSEDEEEEEENGNGNGGQKILRETTAEYTVAPTSDDYAGYKWGIFLRAPEIFFKLMERAKDKFVPLGEIATIQRGLTSGADNFFYPFDITEAEIARLTKSGEFKEYYGIRPSDTNRIRVLKAGDGSVHLVETRFIEPLIFNPMELEGIQINLEQLQRRIFLCALSKEELRKRGFKDALNYIRWGEQERFDQRPTCANRDRWYDVRGGERGAMLWLKTQRYRFITPLNRQGFIANCRLYDVSTSTGASNETLGAILNSTIVALSRYCFGRIQGGDPVSETEVSDVKLMLVPDTRYATKTIANRFNKILKSMSARETAYLVDVDGTGNALSGELLQKDRQDLDDAVLELLGIKSAKEREALRAELYEAMTILYREIRATEKKMQKFRALTARRGRPSPQSIADEIWDTLETKPLAKSLGDFVPAHAATDSVLLPPGKAQLVTNDMFNPNSLRIGGQYVTLGSPERAAYALQLADDEISGTVSIPRDTTICKQALADYHAHTAELDQQFRAHIATFTADEQIQERVLKELWHRARQK